MYSPRLFLNAFIFILFEPASREPVLPPPDFDPDSLELGVGISIEDLLEQQKQQLSSSPPEPERPLVGAFVTTPVSPPSVTAEQKLAAFNDEVNEILRPFKEDVDKSWQRFTADIEASVTPPLPPSSHVDNSWPRFTADIENGVTPPPPPHNDKAWQRLRADVEASVTSPPPPLPLQKLVQLSMHDAKDEERSRRAKFAALDKINLVEHDDIANNEVEPFNPAPKFVRPDHKVQPTSGFSVPINRRPTIARTRPTPSSLGQTEGTATESSNFLNRVRVGFPKASEISTLPSVFEPPQSYSPQISTTPRPQQFFTTSFPSFSGAATPDSSAAYFVTTGGYTPAASTTPAERGRIRLQAGHTPRQRSTTTPTPTGSPISLATTPTTTAVTVAVRPAVSELRYPARSARFENIR